MTKAACTAFSRGLLDLKGFDNSGRWWLGASVALHQAGFTEKEPVMGDAELAALWQKLHAAGKV